MEDPEVKHAARHLWFHLRYNPKDDKKSNMQRVRGSIASYFAKYLGKAIDAPGMVIPGCWWGKLNEASIPLSVAKAIQIPQPVVDPFRRMASKLQSKRVQHGLFASAMHSEGFTISDSNGRPVPVMSLQQFNQARNPIPKNIVPGSVLHDRLFENQLRRQILILGGYRSGRHNRPRPSKFGKITLVGGTMPDAAILMLRHAANMCKHNRENHRPF